MSALVATPESMVAWARAQVDVRWQHHGRKPGKLLDCIGLVICDAQAHGLEVEDWLEYSERIVPAELLRRVERFCVRIERPEPAALALFWIRKKGEPVHAGLCTGEGTFVHAKRELGKQTGKVVESRLSDWAEHVDSYWRHKAWSA